MVSNNALKLYYKLYTLLHPHGLLLQGGAEGGGSSERKNAIYSLNSVSRCSILPIIHFLLFLRLFFVFSHFRYIALVDLCKKQNTHK